MESDTPAASFSSPNYTFIIGGLLLIGFGLATVFRKKKNPLVKSEAAPSANKVEKKKEEKKQAKEVVRSIPIEELHVPASFPNEVAYYFGTQTGTAEKFCGILETEAQTIFAAQNTNRTAKTIDFEEFNEETFKNHHLIIICVATHYEGDPCDNTKKFYKWIGQQRKDKENLGKLLKGLRYVVFGLGDTSYEQFNIIGKQINDWLAELGAERVYKYGEGNAEGNKTEDDFNEWKAELWKEVFTYYHENVIPTQEVLKREYSETIDSSSGPVQHQSNNMSQPVKSYPLVIETVNSDYVAQGEPPLELVSKQYLSGRDVRIKEIRELRQKFDYQELGSTIEVSYDVKEAGMTYKTATNLALFPENTIEDITKVAQLLGFDLEQRFIFKANADSKKANAKHPFPTPCTVREALTKFIDLRGSLRKKLLSDIAIHCVNEEDKKRLTELTTSKEQFIEKVEKPMLGLIDILEEYHKGLNLPLDAFLQITERLMPRYYTIASSNLKYPDEVKIAVALTIDNTEKSPQKFGQTSRCLKDIYEKGDYKINKVTNRIFIKDSLFLLPKNQVDTPIVMVGPGTGVVPFIGFLQEREHEMKAQSRANAHLFFGCRQILSDFIYKEELETFEKNGVLTSSYYAFSREQGKPKTYVQDLMKQQIELVKNILINQNGCLYICGSTKMGQDVQNLIKENLSEEFFKQLEKEKRLIKELWG